MCLCAWVRGGGRGGGKCCPAPQILTLDLISDQYILDKCNEVLGEFRREDDKRNQLLTW